MPLGDLKASPFELELKDDVCVMVRAENTYGVSPFSNIKCQNRIVLQNPAPVRNLTEIESERSVSTLGLQWDEPLSTGGSDQITYLVLQSVNQR
jgi:hypothetical protein